MSDIEQKPALKLSWIKSACGVAEIYANSIHTTWSLDDVRIRFGQVVDSPETPTPGEKFIGVVEERAAVTFAWRNAKQLRDQLTRVISAFESANGEIKIDLKLPPSLP
jgi:hypothetical protein